MTIYVNTDTGDIQDADGNILQPLTLYVKDIIAFNVVFVDSNNTEMTSALLAGGQVLKIGVKSQPGAETLLAVAGAYTLIDEVAQTVLDLNTNELIAYFVDSASTTARGAPLTLEIQVHANDNSARQTYYQGICFMRLEVNDFGDEEPVDPTLPWAPLTLLVLMTITARVGNVATSLDHIPTVLKNTPLAALIRFNGKTGEFWCLDVWDGATVPDGVYVVNPVDFDAATNMKQWTRIL